jgi:hypothetical protein
VGDLQRRLDRCLELVLQSSVLRPRYEGEASSFGWHCDGPVLSGGDYNILPLAVMVAVIIGIPVALGFGLIAFRLIVLEFYRTKRP